MNSMDCYKVRRFLAAYCDDTLSAVLRQDIRSHLSRCPNCAFLSRQYSRGRAALRALPALAPPRRLLLSLRDLASREMARRQAGGALLSGLPLWGVRVRLWASGIMRPMALPVAGGLLSALVLFALIVPNFALHRNPNIADVPTMLSTEPTFVSMGPFGFTDDEVTVEVTLDSQGRFVDYSLPSGQAWGKDPEARRSVENALLFAQFEPGTTFGTPASSRVRMTLRRSRIDVRG